MELNEIRLMMRLFREGESFPVIAERVGYDPSYMREQVRKRVSQKEYDQAVFAIYSKSRKGRDISKAYARSAVIRKERLRQRFSPEVQAAIASRFMAGETIRSIKAEYRTTQDRVSEMIRSVVGPDVFMQAVFQHKTKHLQNTQFKKGVKRADQRHNRNGSCGGRVVPTVPQGDDAANGVCHAPPV